MSSTMTLDSMIKKVKQASQVASTTVMGPEYAQELKNILQDGPKTGTKLIPDRSLMHSRPT